MNTRVNKINYEIWRQRLLEFTTHIEWFPWQLSGTAFSNTKTIKLDKLLKDAGIKPAEMKSVQEKGASICQV